MCIRDRRGAGVAPCAARDSRAHVMPSRAYSSWRSLTSAFMKSAWGEWERAADEGLEVKGRVGVCRR
eukprot:1775112-Prymnesium_polylepis.1